MYRQVKRAISLLLVIVLLFSLSCEAFAQTLVLPASLREIGDEAFYGDESLNEVVIPYGTEYIGERAFACSGLRKILIPASVGEIARSAFDGLSEDFTIRTPKYSYAYGYAMDNGYRWYSSEKEELENVMEILDELDTDEEDAELTIDEMSFELLPTEGITDPEELRLIEEYNACQTELAGLYAGLIGDRDTLIGAFEEYEAFQQETELEITDESMRFNLDGSSFSISPELADVIGENAEIVESYAQNDGSVLLEMQTENGTVFVRADTDGLSLAPEQARPENSADADGFALHDTAAFNAPSSLAERIQNALNAFENFLSHFSALTAGVDTWLDKAAASYDNIEDCAQRQYDTAAKAKTSYGEKYLPQYQRTRAHYAQVQRSIKGLSGLKKLWTGLNLTASLVSLGYDIAHLNHLLDLAQHGHPTDSDRQSLVKYELSKDFSGAMQVSVICLVSRMSYTFFQIADAVNTLLTAVSVVSGPAGWGLRALVTASIRGARALIGRMLRQMGLQYALDTGVDTALQRLDGIDEELHKEMGLRGHVYLTGTETPIPGVRVTIDELALETETDADGAYAFRDVEGGTHSVAFSKEGYDTVQEDVYIGENETETVHDAYLDGKRTLFGTVTAEGTVYPLSGVEVTLTTGGDEIGIYTAYTDADGKYSFSSLPAGTHTITFALPSFDSPEPAKVLLPTNGRIIYNTILVPTKQTPSGYSTSKNFWQWCIDRFDTLKPVGFDENGQVIYDTDGVLDEDELMQVTEIVCYGEGFSSLSGIENFKNLEKLICSTNNLTSLNVSGCKSLTYLKCNTNSLTNLNASGCSRLEELDAYGNHLTNLNVSGCTGLRELNCQNSRLKSLDLSGFSALETLYCSNNGLKSLDLSGCRSLKILSSNQNALTQINMKDCAALTHVEIANNVLTSVDLSGCTELKELFALGNPMTELNISGCTALPELSIADGLLQSLDASGCTALAALYCNDNQLTALDVSGCTALTELLCSNNQLTALDVSGCAALLHINCEGTPLKRANCSGCISLKEFYFPQYLKELNVSGCTALTTLDYNNKQLTALDVSGCTALNYLYCSNNQLTALDLSDCTALTNLLCNNNQLTALNVSGCAALTYLDCSNNQLTALDVSGCTALAVLHCNDNQLTALDVSDCAALNDLYCNNNQLTALNVSGCGALTGLYCENNALTELDVSGCPELWSPSYQGNPLESLNISGTRIGSVVKQEGLKHLNAAGCTEIRNLNLEGGSLESLDVSGCAQLRDLRVSSNPLQSLNVSGCVNLSGLNCNDTALTALDLSSCAALEEVYCNRAPLTSLTAAGLRSLRFLSAAEGRLASLNLANCSALENLHCYTNRLVSLNIAGCIALKQVECDDNLLPALFVSGLPALNSLSCSGNALTELYVTGCPSLVNLYCVENALEVLDASDCEALTQLNCSNNTLTDLNVSGCTALDNLDCGDNALEALNISDCEALIFLRCSGNPITRLDVTGCPQLTLDNILCDDGVTILGA